VLNRSKFIASMGLALSLPAAACAADRTPEQVATHHMAAFATKSLDNVVSDYADDALFVTADGVLQGKAAIRNFWSPRIDGPPLDSKILPAEGSVVSAPWTLGAGTPNAISGKDVFVIRNGKIQIQVVFMDPPKQ